MARVSLHQRRETTGADGVSRPAAPHTMSQERGQPSIRAFFSPVERRKPVSLVSAAGDGRTESPNENLGQNVSRTPVCLERKGARDSAARVGIHVLEESPVSSRKTRAPETPLRASEPTCAKRGRLHVDLDGGSSDEEWQPVRTPCKAPGASLAASSVTQTPTSTVRRFASTPLATPATPSPSSARTPSTAAAAAAGYEEVSGSEWPPQEPEYSFLWPERIRDANQRRPGDPDYDASTLYVPPSFLQRRTGAQAQWWSMKAQHMDTVLFFKGNLLQCLFLLRLVTCPLDGSSGQVLRVVQHGFPDWNRGAEPDSDGRLAPSHRIP